MGVWIRWINSNSVQILGIKCESYIQLCIILFIIKDLSTILD